MNYMRTTIEIDHRDLLSKAVEIASYYDVTSRSAKKYAVNYLQDHTGYNGVYANAALKIAADYLYNK